MFRFARAMIGGFALLAWPAEYAVTGVEPFVVGHDGVVYQKDLGPNTATIADDIQRHDPDESWKPTDRAVILRMRTTSRATKAGTRWSMKIGPSFA